MAYEFKFPDVGEGITEGTLVSWDVEKGSEVKVDQSVAHVETDKAVVEIPSPVSGTVKELFGNKGDTLNVGDVFMEIETSQDSSSQEDASKEVDSIEKEDSSQTSSQDAKPENESTSNTQSSQQDTSKHVEQNSSKKILAMPSVVHEAKKRGIDLSSISPSGNHGQILMSDLDSGTSSKSTPENTHQKEMPSQENKSSEVSSSQDTSQGSFEKVRDDIVASLSVKKLARELGVDINFVVGTGDSGRITQDDIYRAKEMREKHIASTSKEEVSKQEEVSEEQSSSSQQEESLEIKESLSQENSSKEVQSQHSNSIELKGVRGAIAQKMTESLSKAAQVTMCDEVEVSELVALRTKEKEKLKEQGVRLSYLPFIIKAVKHACKLYPEFNGNFNDDSQAFDMSEDLHMGIAVDAPKGLVVPVISYANQKSVVELANDIVELANKAQEGKLSLQEMKGSTFTISSVGSLGATQAFTPILNYPNSAILGVGRIVDKPVCKDGVVVPGKTLTLSLTVDHRVIDGAQAARFLKDIMDLLQDPDLLLMEI